MARFSGPVGVTDTFPSVLHFERELENGVPSLRAYAGSAAIERYLSHDSPGRLMRSLKAYLADRTFEGTSLYGRYMTLADLISAFLRKLLEAAAATLGPIPSHVVVGRPVNFSNERTEAANAFALGQLLKSVQAAGFEHVIFEFEPVAAAYSYEQTLQRDELILVGDFGGGTSDFSILPVGPGARRDNSGKRVILGNDGVAIAGDAFDRQIVRHLVAPALGFGTEYQAAPGKTLPIPNWPYAGLEQWHSLSLLNRPKVLQILERLRPLALDPASVDAFAHFVSADLGFQLHESVRALKIALSHESVATFEFNCGPATISRSVARAEFEGWIQPELAAIGASVDRLLATTGVRCDAIDHVFLTGGSAFVPAVRQLFADRFGVGKIAGGGEFTSVATGLALCAARGLDT
ncbi:MAG: putative chaperone protein [Gammaproteobacteria bacterium]|nr:putative chaperone protein [Gammaproteobacteria bacterium]